MKIWRRFALLAAMGGVLAVASSAARVAVFDERLGPWVVAGAPEVWPQMGGVQGLDGTPFLPDQLVNARLVVRAAFGADPTRPPSTWRYTDITADVLQDNGRTVSMRPGRANWKSTSQPAVMTLALKNLTGAYTAHSPLARWWPYLIQGVPIQVQLWIAGQYWDRFDGEVSGWDPGWDTTGNYAIVTVTANGTLYRIGGGTALPPPLHSALYRSVVVSNPLVYWPMEDKSSATQAASGLTGGSAMAVSGTADFASVATLAGSDTTPDMRNFTLVGRVTGAGSTKWAFEGWVGGNVQGTDTIDGGDVAYLDTTSNNLSRWTIGYSIGNASTNTSSFITLYVLDNPGNAGSPILSTFPYSVGVPVGGWTHWIVEATQSGADVAVKLYVNDVLVETDTIVSRTLGTPVTYQATNIGLAAQAGLMSVGHFAVYSAYPGSGHYRAGLGYFGETVTARLARLCAEEDIPFTAAGGWVDSTPMGPQRVDTLVTLLRECEATGAGFLYDGAGAPGLTYQPLAARYNAPALLTLDASTGQIQPPFDAKDDAFERLNLSTVTNRDGSTATFEDTTSQLGTGKAPTYAGTPPVQPNYSTSVPLGNRAAWEVRKGTIDGFRYPTNTVHLHKLPTKIPAWLQTMPGSPLTITPPYTGTHPPGDLPLVVEGWQEDLSKLTWTVTAFTARGAPYQVGALGTGRLDTGPCTLAADAALGATSLSLLVPGQLLSTAAGDYPCDFWVDGIRVTVTAMAGVASPQTATVTGATVTRQLYAGNTVRLWSPLYPAL